jgi:hypothetical protein
MESGFAAEKTLKLKQDNLCIQRELSIQVKSALALESFSKESAS